MGGKSIKRLILGTHWHISHKAAFWSLKRKVNKDMNIFTHCLWQPCPLIIIINVISALMQMCQWLQYCDFMSLEKRWTASRFKLSYAQYVQRRQSDKMEMIQRLFKKPIHSILIRQYIPCFTYCKKRNSFLGRIWMYPFVNKYKLCVLYGALSTFSIQNVHISW